MLTSVLLSVTLTKRTNILIKHIFILTGDAIENKEVDQIYFMRRV